MFKKSICVNKLVGGEEGNRTPQPSNQEAGIAWS